MVRWVAYSVSESTVILSYYNIINPRRACARVTVLGLCVCVCVSVCLSGTTSPQLSVQLKVPTASAQAGKHFKYGVFSVMASFTYLAVSDPFTASHLNGGTYSKLKVGLTLPRTRSHVTSLALALLFRILSHGV